MILNTGIESMTESEKVALQSQQLQKLVERAYEKTSFYQERMQAIGLTPNEIQTINDLSKLPLMTSKDLTNNYPFGLLTIPVSGIARFQQRSDFNTAVGFTQQDISHQVEMLCRTLVACHIITSSVIMIAPQSLDTDSIVALQQAAESIGITVISSPLPNVTSQIKTLLDFGVTTIFSTPDILFQLADFLKNAGFSTRDLPLMNILCEVHHCSATVRKSLEEQFQIPVYTIYGLAELMNLGIAGECYKQNWLHIHEDHFYPEIIDPHTGSIISNNQPGELVLTTLSREAMPLIRYRTGDMALLEHKPCTCGRTSARLKLVTDK